MAKRILVVSWPMPPRLSGTSVILENLSRQFSPNEMVLAGQAWQGTSEYVRDPALPAIHYIDKEWTWPRRGQSYVRAGRWLALPALVRRLERVARAESCDAIVSVFPNEFFFVCGIRGRATIVRAPLSVFSQHVPRESSWAVAAFCELA